MLTWQVMHNHESNLVFFNLLFRFCIFCPRPTMTCATGAGGGGVQSGFARRSTRVPAISPRPPHRLRIRRIPAADSWGRSARLRRLRGGAQWESLKAEAALGCRSTPPAAGISLRGRGRSRKRPLPAARPRRWRSSWPPPAGLTCLTRTETGGAREDPPGRRRGVPPPPGLWRPSLQRRPPFGAAVTSAALGDG